MKKYYFKYVSEKINYEHSQLWKVNVIDQTSHFILHIVHKNIDAFVIKDNALIFYFQFFAQYGLSFDDLSTYFSSFLPIFTNTSRYW